MKFIRPSRHLGPEKKELKRNLHGRNSIDVPPFLPFLLLLQKRSCGLQFSNRSSSLRFAFQRLPMTRREFLIFLFPLAISEFLIFFLELDLSPDPHRPTKKIGLSKLFFEDFSAMNFRARWLNHLVEAIARNCNCLTQLKCAAKITIKKGGNLY